MGNILKPDTPITAQHIREMQRHYGIKEDGIIGDQTIDLWYRVTMGKHIVTPYHLKLYGVDIFFGKEVIVHDNDGQGLRAKDYPYSMGALFKYISETISICMYDGKPIDEQSKTSCHYHIRKPESVIYTTDGKNWNMKRVKTIYELPSKTKIAIGGMGLTDFEPEVEGFNSGVGYTLDGNKMTYDYSDVHRDTEHIVFGVTHQNNLVLLHFHSKTSYEILYFLERYFTLKHAVMLDGGHVPASFGGGANYNSGMNQANLLQMK